MHAQPFRVAAISVRGDQHVLQNIIKKVKTLLNEDYKNTNVKVLCLGKKINETFKRAENYYSNANIKDGEYIFNNLKKKKIQFLF